MRTCIRASASRATAARSCSRSPTARGRPSSTRPTPGFTNVRKLTDLNPWIAKKALPASELVSYRDADGKVLYGVLRYPIGYEKGRRYPTVFEIYETFFDNGFNGRAALLAGQGYAVFHPSVNLVVGRPGESWAKGVTAAANKLIDMGIADPDRLGVHGTSYGGYATVLLLTETDRFKAAINVSGKVDMISFYTDSERLGVRNTHAPEKSQDRIGGTLWEYPERYIEHSAIFRLDRVKTPLLTISGDQDPNVPANQSRELYYALRRLGKEVEWVRYTNGGHRPPNSVAESIDFENRIVAWYDKYLKPKPRRHAAGRFQHLDEQRLLRVQAVLRLIEHHRDRRLDHFVADLLAAMRGQAVHEERAGLGQRHHRFVHLVALEGLLALGVFDFLAHRRPHVGVDRVDVADRGLRIGELGQPRALLRHLGRLIDDFVRQLEALRRRDVARRCRASSPRAPATCRRCCRRRRRRCACRRAIPTARPASACRPAPGRDALRC